MYTEEYEKRGYPIRNFILKLILVIIFVFLLCWLLPKFIAPTINKTTNGKSVVCNSKDNKNNSGTCDLTGINALTSQIYANNMEKMKDAAISYYTDERLPQEVGQSYTMTLSDMIGLKIITPLIDKNNKACDVEKSYVKITKVDEEYILKVNLKDSETDDYILVHLGCYTYCKENICQKQETSIPIKGSKVTDIVPIKGSTNNGTYVPPKNPTPVVPVNPQPTPSNPKCEIKNGKYYGKNGKVVTKSEYKKQCTTPEEKHYCAIYNDNYYGKDGKIVSYEQYEKQCLKPVEEKHYCVYYNGKYYDKKGKVVTEEEYNKQCTNVPEEKHYCGMYNGKYYGKNGKVVSKEEYEKQCIKEPEYVYEYIKTSKAKLSNWTAWSNWEKTSCTTAEINCNENDLNCLYKLQRLNQKEKIGTYEKSYAKTREVIKQTGSYTATACAKYNYVEINKTLYATTTTTTYTQTNYITRATQASVGGWTYNGRKPYSNAPRDTATTQYIFVGADYSYCPDTCTSLPDFYYDSYTYTGGLTSVSSTTTPGSITSSSSSNTTATTTTSYEASCGGYVTKTIPIYSTIIATEKAKRTEPLYGDVCYKSTKSRTIISKGSTSVKWSTYNDQSLLNNGWAYTGNKKVK